MTRAYEKNDMLTLEVQGVLRGVSTDEMKVPQSSADTKSAKSKEITYKIANRLAVSYCSRYADGDQLKLTNKKL